jgi:hypothetical protein
MGIEIEVDLFGVKKCRHCDPRGSGKCGGCYGTGQNTHLNSSEPKCRECSGSGACRECLGSGKTREISAEDKRYLMPDFIARFLERIGIWK